MALRIDNDIDTFVKKVSDTKEFRIVISLPSLFRSEFRAY